MIETLQTRHGGDAVEQVMCSVPRQSTIAFQRNEGMAAPVQFDAQPRLHFAIPRKGHVLSTVVELYGKTIREAVATLTASLKKARCGEVRAALLSQQPGGNSTRSNSETAAWTIVSIWVVGVAVKAISEQASLAQAEEWFFGPCQGKPLTGLVSDHTLRKAEAALRSEADPAAYFELLPYILDPHGPGSRLSVRRDPATHSARQRKRAEGVFYTPADVAEYMASVSIGKPERALPTVLDPACGTGVFLRAAFQELRRRHPATDPLSLTSECLFGVDIDPWPLDATAFVLLCDCLSSAGHGTVPAKDWRRLRMNLACIDALYLDPASTPRTKDVSGRIAISQLFPALKRGPSVILGNPPYADLGLRPDMATLARVYQTFAVKQEASAEIYPAFIEQMIRLADEESCSGALVLPLSVACNVGSQFSRTREMLSMTRGEWRFAFFDREPHALFGEDVKTRNAIMLWSRTAAHAIPSVFTGPLRKWRGESRAEMFRGLRFTAIDRRIGAGIPKIEGDCQATALQRLSSRLQRLGQVSRSIERVRLYETSHADDTTVFVGPTAYNFLNVFLRPPRGFVDEVQSLSEHPLHAVRCASRADALAIFAILSSHLAYWWWHTHGDGFHVSKRFIAELPFGIEDLTENVVGALSKSGAALWSLIQSKPIISLNRGRTSLAFTPNGYDDIRRRIDEVLADVAGLESAFIDELQQFTARTVAATLPKYAITNTQGKG